MSRNQTINPVLGNHGDFAIIGKMVFPIRRQMIEEVWAILAITEADRHVNAQTLSIAGRKTNRKTADIVVRRDVAQSCQMNPRRKAVERLDPCVVDF